MPGLIDAINHEQSINRLKINWLIRLILRNFTEFYLKLRKINRINRLKVNQLVRLILHNFTKLYLLIVSKTLKLRKINRINQINRLIQLVE